MGFGIQNTAQGIRDPTNDWHLESNFHWQRIRSTAWNPESKNALDYLTWGEINFHVGLILKAIASFITYNEVTRETASNSMQQRSLVMRRRKANILTTVKGFYQENW